MKLVNYLVGGVAFFMVIIFLFNLISQFLQILGLFEVIHIKYIGIISILLATDNLLTKSFFGYDIIKIN